MSESIFDPPFRTPGPSDEVPGPVFEKASTMDEAPPPGDAGDLLLATSARGASDLMCRGGELVAVQINGRVQPLDEGGRMVRLPRGDMAYRYLGEVADLTEAQLLKWKSGADLDVSRTLAGGDRFRINLHHAMNQPGLVARHIPKHVRPLQELGLPDVLSDLASLPRGLVLVCGPTGSGKTTTLGAMIDQIVQRDARHIVTIEDPIEIVHRTSGRSVVRQRELGTDVDSFPTALRSALRQAPDVVLVGEMRDPETIQLAVTVAETGHLVFATLHTTDAPTTVDRIVEAMPDGQQNGLRSALALILRAVVVQTLVPTADGAGRVPAVEIMLGNRAIREHIRKSDSHMLHGEIEGRSSDGMIRMEESLANLVRAGRITVEAARNAASDRDVLNRFLEKGRGAR